MKKDSDKAKSWEIMSESYWDLSRWEDFLISYGNLDVYKRQAYRRYP